MMNKLKNSAIRTVFAYSSWKPKVDSLESTLDLIIALFTRTSGHVNPNLLIKRLIDKTYLAT